MAAPGLVTRTTPTGAHMPDGFGACRFAFGRLPSFGIREFEITPGKITGGTPIPQTTFFNLAWHTKAPQVLLDIENFKIKGQYSPDILKPTSSLLTLINQPGACSFVWPQGSSFTFFGYAMSATFGVIKEGTLPEVEIEVVVTNYDPVLRIEAAPVYVAGYAGTSDG